MASGNGWQSRTKGDRHVAIIGAGPAGLVAARYLRTEGFEPVIFEQSQHIAGQWSGDRRHSGVWPGMRTNTSRIMTAFSDVPSGACTAVYPTAQEVCAYLTRYAETFDLLPVVRTATRVTGLRRSDLGWTLQTRDARGVDGREVFARVVVATGRHHEPLLPTVPGLETFAGLDGAIHAFTYPGPHQYRDRRVLVCGGNLSALEIASEIAMGGAARVACSARRQRYVLPKLLAGVPADHVAFTRFGALAAETMPAHIVAQGLKELILRTSGHPEQYGAAAPDESVLEAGVTLSQQFLPLVAEGRIACRPWVREVHGQTVRFADGREEQFDALIFATGYGVSLPFLDPAIHRALGLDVGRLMLHNFTFHPDLPGLALLGLFDLMGPYFPVLELQARWIAYCWSGTRPVPSAREMRAGIDVSRSRPHLVPMHTAAILLAREAGAEPDLQQWPELARPLLFGPLTPMSFRLSGPGHAAGAHDRVVADAAAFGAVPGQAITEQQSGQLHALAASRNDSSFTKYVEAITQSH